MDFKKPNIFVVGPSGTGKSSSLRNLDPTSTVILNLERKQLPFRQAAQFTRQKHIATLDEFNKFFDGALKSATAKAIIIESFTSLCEIIMMEARAKFGKKGSGTFDQYDFLKFTVREILSRSKNTDKYVIFIGIDETIEDSESIVQRMIKVEGKALKGSIEKEFVIVLHTTTEKSKSGKTSYFFLTNSDGTRSAKSPMDMLDYQMDNDLQEVINKVEEYYGVPEAATSAEPVKEEEIYVEP